MRDQINIDAKLDAILDHVLAIRAVVDAQAKPAPRLSKRDRNAMTKMLPVLAAHFHGDFQAWELIDRAKADDVLAANLRIVIGKRSAQTLGILFARCQGHTLGGIELRRSRRDANGRWWRCAM